MADRSEMPLSARYGIAVLRESQIGGRQDEMFQQDRRACESATMAYSCWQGGGFVLADMR